MRLREKRNFPWRFNVIWVVQSCLEKYFASGIPQISGFIGPVPFPEGRIAIVTNAERNCDGRGSIRRNHSRGRMMLQRTAKSCGSGAPMQALRS
jgi:hypothetical protein